MSNGRYKSRISRPSARKFRSIQDRARPVKPGAEAGGAEAITDSVCRNPHAGNVIPSAGAARPPGRGAMVTRLGGHDERQGRRQDGEPLRLSLLGLDGEGRSGLRPGARTAERRVGRRGQGALDQVSRDGHHRDPRLSRPRGRRGDTHAPGDPARRHQARAARGDRVGGGARRRADPEHGRASADAARPRGRVQEVARPDNRRFVMAKAYWIACYHAIKNPDAMAAYAKLAAPAIQAAGGRFLVRGMPAKTYEAGMSQRVVVIEFDSVAQATAAHDSPGYQAALKELGSAAERDIRIVEGVS